MYQVIALRPPNTSGDLEPTTAQYLRLVTWAPTGNALAYVDYNNNIHYRWTWCCVCVCVPKYLTFDFQGNSWGRRWTSDNKRNWRPSLQRNSWLGQWKLELGFWVRMMRLFLHILWSYFGLEQSLLLKDPNPHFDTEGEWGGDVRGQQGTLVESWQ